MPCTNGKRDARKYTKGSEMLAISLQIDAAIMKLGSPPKICKNLQKYIEETNESTEPRAKPQDSKSR